MDFQKVRNLWVAELAEEGRVGVAWECTAGLTEGFRLIVAVRVDQPHALAGKIHRVLQLPHGGVVAVMAIGVHDAKRRWETAASRCVQSRQGSRGVSEDIVEVRAQVVVHQAHARVPISRIAGRRAEVLAEDHRVIAPHLCVEDGISVVWIGKAARDVELPLDAAEVARIARVLVRPALLAEKIVGHVFHRIQS